MFEDHNNSLKPFGNLFETRSVYICTFREYAQLSKNPKGDIRNTKSIGIFCNGTEKNLYDCQHRGKYAYCYHGSAVFTCPKGMPDYSVLLNTINM